MPTIFFEDVELHEKYSSEAYHLTDKDVVEFAQQWDPMPFHINPELAKKTMFEGLVASGLHQLVICHRLAVDSIPRWEILAGLGIDQIRFLAPARPGDTLIAEGEVLSKRQSQSKPNTGIVETVFTLVNQHGETVLSYITIALVRMRPKEG